MEKIIKPIVKLDNEKFKAIVDLKLYSKEAITATIYKYSNLFYINQVTDSVNSDLINIFFESKNGNIVTEITPKEFCNDLIDQQLRYNINKQFGHIRDMIVEEAFKPVNTK